MSGRFALLFGLGCLALAALHAGPAWRAVNACGPPQAGAALAVEAPAPGAADVEAEALIAVQLQAERS